MRAVAGHAHGNVDPDTRSLRSLLRDDRYSPDSGLTPLRAPPYSLST